MGVRVSDMLRELVFDDRMSVAEAADRYLTEDFSAVRSGRLWSRAEFVALAEGARARAAEAKITVLQELRDDEGYADRHRNEVTWKDGSTSTEEIYIFATYGPDGRFASLHETPVPVTAQQER